MIDPEEQGILDTVQKHGWSAMAIDDDPAGRFIYTVGLMETFNHPELCVFGLHSSRAHGILSAMVKIIRGGASFAPGEPLVDPTGHPLLVAEVSVKWHERFFGYAMWHCRHCGRMGELSVLQVLWSDHQGRFPDDSSCDPKVIAMQPVLAAGSGWSGN